jgi:hypothetical protein
MTTLPSSCTEIWEPPPSGTLRDCPDLYKDLFIFYLFYVIREQVMFFGIGSLYPPARTITVPVLRVTKKGTLYIKGACIWCIALYSKLNKKGLVYLEKLYLQ